jgi:hypothetical protein
VQTYPYQDAGTPAATGDSIAASVRDAFEEWTITQLKDLRQLFNEGVDESDSRAQSIITELEASAIDWKTFLIKTDDSFKFPMMAYANHTWFQLRQLADLERDRRIITGRRQEASNLLPDGRAPNSAFFTRTEISSYTPDRLNQEFAEFAPVGKITITKEKKDGTSEGFFGKDERGLEYIFIFDAPFNPEMQTAAEQIGSTLVRIMGWRVPKTVICEVQGTGNPQYDGRRAAATLAVRKFSGGWTYRSYRNRREIRGLATVAAWLNNVDQSEHNTGISQPHEGVYVYYIWDYGASLGSFTFRPKWPRLGWEYLFDPVRQSHASLTGAPWQREWKQYSAAVGYFDDNFDPDRWVPFYPNLAFDDATLSDRCWAASRMAQITDDQIRCVVRSARYTHETDMEYVIATLIARRDRVVNQYLGRSCSQLIGLDAHDPSLPARVLKQPPHFDLLNACRRLSTLRPVRPTLLAQVNKRHGVPLTSLIQQSVAAQATPELVIVPQRQ